MEEVRRTDGKLIFIIFLILESILFVSNFFIRGSITVISKDIINLFLYLTVLISISFTIVLMVFTLIKDKDKSRVRLFFSIVIVVIFLVSLDFFKIYSSYEDKISLVIKGFDLIENAALIVFAKLVVDFVFALEIPVAF